MKKVSITIKNFDQRFPAAYSYLLSHGIEVEIKDSVNNIENIKELKALFVAAEPVNKELLDKMPSVGIISKMGSGMDNIDLDECKARNIAVSNSRGCNSNAVAETTILLILSSLKQARRMTAAAASGTWSERTAVPLEEINGKTVGLIGFGGIARRVAQLLEPFNARIISYDPFMNIEEAKKLNVEPVSFEDLLSKSEIISVHIPGTPDNVGLFNRDTFAKMSQKPYFINCSRGSLVVEDDLYEALSKGTLRGAATDVWSKEPVEPNNKLFTLPNFTGTPHIAGMSVKCAYDDSMTVVKSIVEYFENKEIHNRVV